LIHPIAVTAGTGSITRSQRHSAAQPLQPDCTGHTSGPAVKGRTGSHGEKASDAVLHRRVRFAFDSATTGTSAATYTAACAESDGLAFRGTFRKTPNDNTLTGLPRPRFCDPHELCNSGSTESRPASCTNRYCFLLCHFDSFTLCRCLGDWFTSRSHT